MFLRFCCVCIIFYHKHEQYSRRLGKIIANWMIFCLGKFLFDFIGIFLYNIFTNIRKAMGLTRKIIVKLVKCETKGAMLC